MKKVISVRFKDNGKTYYFDPADTPIKTGDYVIVETARGVECGEVVQGVKEIADSAVPKALKPITRMADSVDVRRMRQNREDEKRAYHTCQECIARHGLEMKLVEAEYTLDRSKIMFYFTADGRVDFRELVKDLAGIFHTRIELRQIGVRDKAKMVGGLGICGRPFCCASFLDDFQPVSIKMAKSQNLSLNPTKISGTCGRLMCCLKYEQDTYEALIRTSPKPESFVDTPDGRGTVMEVDILRQRVKVRMEKDPDTVNTYENEDVAVLRSGKAKKNDAPIPADLAPISGGSGPRKKKETSQEDAMVLEPIRFRYSTESVVDEAPKAAEAPQAGEQKAEEPKPPRQRRQDRPRRPRPPKEDQEKPAGNPAEKREYRDNRPPRQRRQDRPKEEPNANGGPQQASRPPRRRNNYRGYRKPNKPQE